MSEESVRTNDQVEEATDAEVTAAVDALVESVKAQEGAAAQEAPKKKTTRRKSDEAVDTLVQTVNTLAATVTTLSGTIETLGAQKAAPQPEPEVASDSSVAEAGAEAEPAIEEGNTSDEDQRPSLIGFLSSWFSTVAPFVAAGLIGWAVMQSKVNFAVFATLLACVSVLCAVAYLRRKNQFSLPFVIGELLLGIGAGAVVGAIAFFSEHPHRASVLVPLAVVVTVVGAVLRSPKSVAREHLIWLAGGGVWVCMALYFGLYSLVPSGSEAEAVPAAEHEAVAGHGSADTHAVDGHSSEAQAADSHAPDTQASGDHAAADAADHGTEAAPAAGKFHAVEAVGGEGHDAPPAESHEAGTTENAAGATEATDRMAGVPLSKTDAAHVAEAIVAAAAAASAT